MPEPKPQPTPRAKAKASAEPLPPPAPTLGILDTRVLRGPNVWHKKPVIRMSVDLGVLEQYPSDTIPGFNEALMALLPTMEEHACSLGRRGGFFSRLLDGTWMGHVAEHIALELQCLAGTEVRIGKTRSSGQTGRYEVIYEYREEQVGMEAGHIAVALVNYLIAPDDADAYLDLPDALERLIRIAERSAFGPSTQAIIDEAVSRDIPWIRLDRHSLVQLGQGKYQQRIRATMTSQTSAIAVDIASDKALTNQLLASAGLPVPRSETVDQEDDAVAAARTIGYPVVVKPLDGNHGRGVCLDLRNEEDVRKAFPIALRESRGGDVVVETYVHGADHRALIVGGRLVAIAERIPAGVTADGTHTVRELVDIENSDHRRGFGHEKVLTRIKVDEAALELIAKQGFTLDSVPDPGVRVQLALTGNMSTGGTSIDRTMETHPENIEIAETAAQVVGLDIAGIDMVVPDIGAPIREQGGAIVEVNAAPGFRMHTHPTEGEPQYVAKPVIDLLFPAGTDARIPIIGVTGTNGKTTTVRMIAHILKLMGRRVGMTTTDGIVIDGRLTRKGDMSGPRSARTVLQNPLVDTAVFEVARGGLLREGLGYDRNDVAVVTNVTGDHLGLHGIDTVAQLAAVKSVLVDAVPRNGTAVLNADDPLVARMARQSDGQVIYFSMQTQKGRGGVRPGRRPLRTRRRGDGHPRDRRRRAAGAAPGVPDDAAHPLPSHPRHARREGPDERRQRARCRRRGVGRGRAPARHPAGSADVQHLLLPGTRAPQRGRRAGLQGRHRLLPQRRRHAPPGRVRGPDHDRRGTAWPTRRASGSGGRHGRASRHRRRGHRHPGRPARPGPVRIRRACRGLVRRDHRARGQEPAWPQARRECGERAGGDPPGAWRRGSLQPVRGHPRRAGGCGSGHAPRPSG